MHVRRWYLRRGVVALACTAISGCDLPTTAVERPTPVVAVTLYEGEPVQYVSVTLATNADSTLPLQAVPVPAADVKLSISDDSGGAWPVTPTITPGRFVALVTPLQGRTYTLSGQVRDRPVHAETRVPAFTLQKPVGDTIRSPESELAPCSSHIGVAACYSVVGSADVVVSIWCRITDLPGYGYPEGCWADSTGRGRVLQADHRPDVRSVDFFAYNAQVGISRPGGALVEFGAVAVVRRKLYVP